MAEACYTARATTEQQVLNGVNKLTLQTNEHSQYMHDAILLLQKGIRRVLVSQFNPSSPGKGMKKLLDDGNNLLTLVKSIDAITANSATKEAKKQADKLTAPTGKTILPSITAQVEAQEEASQQCHQSIGHWRQRRCGRSHHQISWQQHHQCHPPDGHQQQLQKHQQIHTIQSNEIGHQRRRLTIHKRHVRAAARGDQPQV
jgi:hypothetical protein